MDLLKDHDLPGGEIVAALERAEYTIEGLLVALAPARLREIGLKISEAADLRPIHLFLLGRLNTVWHRS